MSEVAKYWQVVKREGLKITLKRSTDALEKEVFETERSGETAEKKIRCDMTPMINNHKLL